MGQGSSTNSQLQHQKYSQDGDKASQRVLLGQVPSVSLLQPASFIEQSYTGVFAPQSHPEPARTPPHPDRASTARSPRECPASLTPSTFPAASQGLICRRFLPTSFLEVYRSASLVRAAGG